MLHTSVRRSILSLYPGDSFYTLTTPAAAGLLILSASLISLLMFASWRSTEFWVARCPRRSAIGIPTFFCLDIGITLLLYAALLMLVPQIYYVYYQIVFENLPVQWVAKSLSFETFVKLVQLEPGASMSDHLAGFTAWMLLFNMLIHWSLKIFIKPFPLPN